MWNRSAELLFLADNLGRKTKISTRGKYNGNSDGSSNKETNHKELAGLGIYHATRRSWSQLHAPGRNSSIFRRRAQANLQMEARLRIEGSGRDKVLRYA
jgi:hypothetical protein